MRVATFHHHIVSTQNSAWHINKYYVNELVLIVDILPFWNGLHLKPIKLASSKVYLKWMGSCDRHGGTPPRNTFRKGMWHQLLGMMSVGGQLLQELLQLQGVTCSKINPSWGRSHTLAYKDTAISSQCRPTPKDHLSSGARVGSAETVLRADSYCHLSLCPICFLPSFSQVLIPKHSQMDNLHTTLHFSIPMHFPGNSTCITLYAYEKQKHHLLNLSPWVIDDQI